MNNKCLKIASDIQSGDCYGVKFMKRHKLTLNEFRVIEDMIREFANMGKTGCFQDKVAYIFGKYGFTITPDEHTVMFYVS